MPESAKRGTTDTQDDDEIIPAKKKNLCDIVAGDIDPSTNKKIIYIVYQATTFLVSIDAVLNLNWTTTKAYGENNFAEDFGEVVGSCNMADAMVDRIFTGKRNRMAYKKMLGEVISRVLDDNKSDSAIKLLLIVDKRIDEHCRERVRMAYIFYAFFTVCLLGLFTSVIVWFRPDIDFLSADPNRYRLIIATFLGGIGAFITTFIRFRKYEGSIVAGLPIHRLDGFLRIFYGIVAGLIITLAIKGNVLIGFANSSALSQPWLGYFLAMVGGASEILIPNLIQQAEQNLGINIKKSSSGKTSKDHHVDDSAEEQKKNGTAKSKAGKELVVAEKTKVTEAAKNGHATAINDKKDHSKKENQHNEDVSVENNSPEDYLIQQTTEQVELDLEITPANNSFTPAQSKNLL